MSLKIGIVGIAGRMGQAICEVARQKPEIEIIGGVDDKAQATNPTTSQATNADRPPLFLDLSELAAKVEVLIDFSSPKSLPILLEAAQKTKTNLVICTTGLNHHHHQAIDQAAKRIAILQTGNTSLGVVLLAAMIEQVAAKLGAGWDIEIVEMHHRDKVDAPSGTAWLLGEAVAKGRGVNLSQQAVTARSGETGARTEGTIGFATLRGGSVAGDHQVIFAGDGERLEFTHRAENRTIFAKGALKAALWLADKSAGRYQMRDVLGL